MLTVVLARLDAPVVFELREAVRDWTATGLLTGSIWVDAADVSERALDTPCVVVEPGHEPRVSGLLTVLGDHQDSPVVRLVSVQLAGDPDGQVDSDTVQAVRQQVAGSGVRVVRVNVIVPTTADGVAQSAPVMLSTPNVLLQPADGANPSAPAVPVDRDSTAFLTHCAGGLASVGGLWAGQSGSPYDDEQMWAGALVEMVRWFRRAVDGSLVWSGLRTSVAPDQGTPGSVDPAGRPLDVIPPTEVPAQLQRTHDALLQATASLTGPAVTQPFVPPPKRTIGLGQALREFFRFLATALVNAPARWLAGTVDEASRSIAAKATAAIYGREADVQVMFNGRVPERHTGAGEDIGALSSAAADVAGRLRGHLPVPPEVAPFADLFTYSATALLDGGHRRDSVVALPARGTDAVVVGDPHRVAPHPAAAAFRVPPALGLPAEDGVLTPWSPYSAVRVREQLLALEEQEVQTGGGRAGRLNEIQQARTRLDEWAGQQGAFSWMVQLTIARRLIAARREFASAAEELRADPSRNREIDDLTAREAAQRRKVRWTLFALPLLIVLVFLLGWLAPTLVAVIGAVVLVIGWLVTLVVGVLGAQRLAWQMMYARDLASARRRWLAEQVERMAAEVYRLAVAYACAESWARVVSGVVHLPYGTRTAGGTVAATAPDDTPLEMQSVTGRFEPAAMAEMVSQVRRSVLPPGWLGVELHRRVGDIARRLQAEAGWDDAPATFSDAGVDASRELVVTASRIAAHDVVEAAGASLDDRIQEAIDQVERARGGSWALGAISVGDQGGRGSRGTGGSQSAAEFLQPLSTDPTGGRLPALGFAPGGSHDAAVLQTPVVVPTAGVAMSSLPGAARGTVFDRGVIRLDRGRRVDPRDFGVVAPAAPAVDTALGTVDHGFPRDDDENY